MSGSTSAAHAWELAPAYDVNPVPIDIKPRVLATAIDRDDNTASLDLVMSVAGYFELDDGEAEATSRLAALTPQQFRVLSMLSAGLLNKQIAAELGVSEATVKAHVSAVMQKLGVSNRTQAVLLAQKLALDQRAAPDPGG